jgi:antitoxin component of RelBE/YafQ-DinJ toxin-antitoxin module
VILFAGKPVVSIQRFLCAQILKGKTCDALTNEYHTSQKDNFDSYAGYTFYKHTTNVRTVFDGTLFGYAFKNIDDDMMLNISSMIHIVNQDFIIENKLPVIQAKCANDDEYLKTIESSKIQYGNPKNISLLLKGESNKKQQVQCTINFDTWNERTVTKSVFSKQ